MELSLYSVFEKLLCTVQYFGKIKKEDAVHLPLASSRAQTARWAAVRGGAASGGVGGACRAARRASPPVRGAGTGCPAARCVARGKVSATSESAVVIRSL